MRRRRRAAEHRRGRQLARHALDHARRAARPGSSPRPRRSLRARDPLEDLLLVRVAAEDVRQVEHERDAVDRHARREQPLELDARASSPASDAVSSSEAAPDGPQRLARARRAASADGPPCSTVSAAVTVTTRSVSTSAGETRSGSPRRRAELDQVVGLGVVDDHAAAEAAAELGRDEQPDLARRRTPARARRRRGSSRA